MKLRRIIRIAAAAGALAIWGGCARLAVPEEPDGKNAIGFNAGALLLQDDAPTKAGTLKEGKEFVVGDKIDVFGRRYGNSRYDEVFNGTTVTKTSATEWEYSPPKAWYWLSEGDYYDFLGVYPSGKGTSRIDGLENLAIKTPYSLSTDNYDLMYALYRRSGSDPDRIAAVPLDFHHVLCVVRIVFINDSNDSDITIDSYKFTNMVVSADAKATMDAIGKPEITWINTTRNSSTARSATPGSKLYGKNTSDKPHSYTGAYDFFIPTALDATSNGTAGDQEHMPHLIIQFTAGQSSIEKSILLKDIQRNPFKGDTTPVDVWEAGVRYTYNISIRLDGGVQITVITTEWDNIYAETPGVMIE